MVNINDEVTQFLDNLNHPLRKEIEELRQIILSSENGLIENIKWNGPNYCFNDADRITMRIQPQKQIQLIFHRGAKKITQPVDKFINDESGILVWKENDRAITTFKSKDDIKKNKNDLCNIVKKWIEATK